MMTGMSPAAMQRMRRPARVSPQDTCLTTSASLAGLATSLRLA